MVETFFSQQGIWVYQSITVPAVGVWIQDNHAVGCSILIVLRIPRKIVSIALAAMESDMDSAGFRIAAIRNISSSSFAELCLLEKADSWIKLAVEFDELRLIKLYPDTILVGRSTRWGEGFSFRDIAKIFIDLL